jgi:hypothetical protein
MVVCLLGMATSAFAQFTNAKASSSFSSNGGDIKGWSSLKLSYHPMSFVPDQGDSEGCTGLSLGYARSFAVSQNHPLFLEVGANLLWTTYDMTDIFEVRYYYDDFSAKLNMFSVNVPVNFGYKYSFNEDMFVYPYIGVNFRINAVGKIKCSAEDESKNFNIFDKDDMCDLADNMGDTLEYLQPFERFQAGWQIGVAFGINRVMLAASYGKDFTEILEKTKMAMPSITLGITF